MSGGELSEQKNNGKPYVLAYCIVTLIQHGNDDQVFAYDYLLYMLLLTYGKLTQIL